MIRSRSVPVLRVEAFEARLFLSAGDLDPTFGAGGKVLTPDGLRRYAADGSPDATFGNAGFVPITGYYPQLVALRPDDSIIVVGDSFTSSPEEGSEFVLAHFSAGGSADLAFGGGFAVGFIKSGEYLEYTVNTGAARPVRRRRPRRVPRPRGHVPPRTGRVRRHRADRRPPTPPVGRPGGRSPSGA